MDRYDLKRRGLVRNNFTLPYNPDLAERAKELRNHMTSTEEKLWTEFLHGCGYRFRPQKQIDNFIVDFYCAKLKLVIEIDGEIHDEINRVEYDQERTKVLESYGLKVIRFNNEDVMNHFQEVCNKIIEFFS